MARTKKPDPIASALAKKRWRKATEAARRKQGQYLAEGRRLAKNRRRRLERKTSAP